jgi:ubiquinone/menaquinone biosynthesis C-methylase UbiE
MQLLPREALVKTGPVDHADWNYRPVLGFIQRMRWRLVRAFLGAQRFGRLLEIGYGSGVFMPELARHCDDLYGLDIHEHNAAVTEVLARSGVKATLVSGSATAMPFADAFFDCLVAVSSLEFINDLPAACREMLRVLKPGGLLVVITPGSSPLVDLGLKILTGKSAKTDFEDRRKAIIPTLLEHFAVQQRRAAPRFGSFLVHLYTGLKLSPLGNPA